MRSLSNSVLLLGLCVLLTLFTSPVQGQPAMRSQVVSYQIIPGPEPTDVLLQQCLLLGNGQSNCQLLKLPLQFKLEAAASSGPYNLFFLRKTAADTVQLLLTDSLGQVMRQPRQFLPRLHDYPIHKPQLLGLPAGQGFVLTYPTMSGKISALHVVRLGINLEVQWEQQLVNKEFYWVERLAADATHLWLYLHRYIGPVTRQPRVWAAQLATGQPTASVDLSPTEETEAAELVPGGWLLLGNTHRNYLPEPTDGVPGPALRRRDIVRLIAPDGQQPIFTTIRWPKAGRPFFHWSTLRPLPDGRYQLVGETYREVMNGGVLALAVLGVGLTGFGGYGFVPTSGYVNERPEGLVVAELSATGALGRYHTVRVPEALHTSTEDSTKRLPKGKPTGLRVRGLADQRYVVLNTTRQVLLYSLDHDRLMPLVPARRSAPVVLNTAPGHVNVGWPQAPGHPLPAVEHWPLP